MRPLRAFLASFSAAALRVVLASFFLQLGFQSVYFVGVIGTATYTLGADAFAVSGLVFVMNVAVVLGSALAGPLIDRIGPRRTLLSVLVAMSLGGFAGWLLPASYAVVSLLAGVVGTCFGFGTTCVDAYPRFLTTDAGELQRCNSLANLATGVAVVVGPALSGVLATALTSQAAFSILAFAALPGLALVWATPEQITPAPSGGGGHLLSDLAEGFRITFGHRYLRLLFFVGFLGFFAYGAFDSLESLFYRDVLHAGAEWMGYLSAISGVGGTVGSLLVLAIPAERANLSLLCDMLLVTGVGSMVYVGTGSIPVACAGQLITGVGFGSMAPLRVTLTQRHCDVSNVGRVTSVMRVGLNGAGVLPLLVAPFLAQAFGVQAVLLGASTAVVVMGLVFAILTARR